MPNCWLFYEKRHKTNNKADEGRERHRTEKDQAFISQLVSYTLKNNTVQQVQVNLVTFHKRREALVGTAGESDIGSQLKSWVAVQAAVDGDVSPGSVSEATTCFAQTMTVQIV